MGKIFKKFFKKKEKSNENKSTNISIISEQVNNVSLAPFDESPPRPRRNKHKSINNKNSATNNKLNNVKEEEEEEESIKYSIQFNANFNGKISEPNYVRYTADAPSQCTDDDAYSHYSRYTNHHSSLTPDTALLDTNNDYNNSKATRSTNLSNKMDTDPAMDSNRMKVRQMLSSDDGNNNDKAEVTVIKQVRGEGVIIRVCVSGETQMSVTTRSEADFEWLAKAWRHEFHGTILIRDLPPRSDLPLCLTWLQHTITSIPKLTSSSSYTKFLFQTHSAPHNNKLSNPHKTAPTKLLTNLFECVSPTHTESDPYLTSLANLFAQRHRHTTTLTKTLSNLNEHESIRGILYKKLAIGLAKLFVLECDIQINISDTKIIKSKVEDTLRQLSRIKTQRSVPNLSSLASTIGEYVSDLAGASESIRVYESQSTRVHFDTQNLKNLKNLNCASSTNQHSTNNLDPNNLDKKIFAKLTTSLHTFLREFSLLASRISWRYFKTEESSVTNFTEIINSSRSVLHSVENDLVTESTNLDQSYLSDDALEIALVKRILSLNQIGVDADRNQENKRLTERALSLATSHIHSWTPEVALAILVGAGVSEADMAVEETSRELRVVRKYAMSLRGCVSNLLESVDELAVSKLDRSEFYEALTLVLSGGRNDPNLVATLRTKHGIDILDRAGWGGHDRSENRNVSRANCGPIAHTYCKLREIDESLLLSRLKSILSEYMIRVTQVESYVYLHAVGIQLEKHFSGERASAVAAWEKKTDLITAINIATRKRLPLLVNELKAKLDNLPSEVSHTTAKRAKESHLASKSIKQDLIGLARRRFERARVDSSVSTSRVLCMIKLWVQYEESACLEELRCLGEVLREIEGSVVV